MNLDTSDSLQRFVSAQQGIYETVVAELKTGCKRSHWMWFIFPQLAGLGQSPTARLYAIRNSDEARSYLNHPLLGARLRECSQLVLAVEGRSAFDIFGYPDEVKLRSSMTLFMEVAGHDSIFARVLQKYFGGEADARTLELLAQQA